MIISANKATKLKFLVSRKSTSYY